MKKFNLYTVADARDFVEAHIPSENQDDYKYKKLHRKQDEILLLKRKSFEKLKDEIDTPLIVAGRIRKRQLRYKDYKGYNELVEKKNKKKIYGKSTLLLPCNSDEPSNKDYKDYDVRKDANRHIYGYAWIGDNKFLKVTTFNPLLLLIPLICVLLILFLFKGCPDDFNPIDIIDDDITDTTTQSDQEQAPLCYYVPFNEKTQLSSDNPYIRLLNVKENEGNYYISYEVYIDNELIYFENRDGIFYITDESSNAVKTIGVIEPNKQAALNLWEGLSEGDHELIVIATDYDYSLLNEYRTKQKQALLKQATKPVTHTLKTTLVVEK